MTINITPIDISSNNWGDFIQRVNQLINFAATQAVTSGGNPTGGLVDLTGDLRAVEANITDANITNLMGTTANIATLTMSSGRVTGALTLSDPASAGVWDIGVAGGLFAKNKTAGQDKFAMQFANDGSVVFGGITNMVNHPSVALSIMSNNRGFLPPVLTTAERMNIASPKPGIIVYDSTQNVLYIHNNNQWAALLDGAVHDAADMRKAVYDPQGVNGDAFNVVNQHGYAALAPYVSADNNWVIPVWSAANGVRSMFATTGVAAGRLPVRGSSGEVFVRNTPAVASEATSKQYVDTQISTESGTNWANTVSLVNTQIATRVPNTRNVATGTGLTGGGTLAADKTIALNPASIASLAKADSAVQPSVLGTSATRNVGTTSGTVAAGDDPRIVNAANTANMTTSINNAVAPKVSGPASAGDGNLPIFSGVSGKIVSDSGRNIDWLRDRTNHTGLQAIATIQNLQTTLSDKVNKNGDTGLGGFWSNVYDLGTSSGKNITVDPTLGNFQSLSNDGAFTLTAPATVTGRGYTMCIITSGNGGACTTVGFTKVIGRFRNTGLNFINIKIMQGAKIISFEEAN